MTSSPVAGVWFWRCTKSALRAVYGRRSGPYSKDYLQTSGRCSEAFDRLSGRSGRDAYTVTYRWPGGSRSGEVRPGGDYRPPDNYRLNFRWPFDDAPLPWKLSPSPGALAAFPGTPDLPTEVEADAQVEQFLRGNFDPWLLAVMLVGERNVLHVRAYMSAPPSDRAYASTNHLPPALRAEMASLGRTGCGTYVPDATHPSVPFDPGRVFDAWDVRLRVGPLGTRAAAGSGAPGTGSTAPPSVSESQIDVGDDVEPGAPTSGTRTLVHRTTVEGAFQETARRRAAGPTTIELQEHGLVRSYEGYLTTLGHDVTAHIYAIPGEKVRIRCDLFDETALELVEAKGRVSRNNVRMALGQLADYRRFERPHITRAVLLPSKPPRDLEALVLSTGAALVWRDPQGTFTRKDP
jgi:hypothetical protein